MKWNLIQNSPTVKIVYSLQEGHCEKRYDGGQEKAVMV